MFPRATVLPWHQEFPFHSVCVYVCCQAEGACVPMSGGEMGAEVGWPLSTWSEVWCRMVRVGLSLLHGFKAGAGRWKIRAGSI